MSAFATSGPFARESKADAWLFEHSKFLRKHFHPNGPAEIPSKHDLVQQRASGDVAFPRESKMDAALFEHSKFLRNHIKHEESVDGEIKGKSAMLRESFDSDRPRTPRSPESGSMKGKKKGLLKTMRRSRNSNGPVELDDNTVAAVQDNSGVIPGATTLASEHTHPANDSERIYGNEASLRSAAAAATPGLISIRPTTMDSVPAVERPVLHSLQSNSARARVLDETTTQTTTTMADAPTVEDPMVRVRRAQDLLRRWSEGGKQQQQQQQQQQQVGDVSASIPGSASVRSKRDNQGAVSARNHSHRYSQRVDPSSSTARSRGHVPTRSGGYVERGEYEFLQPYR